MIENLNKENYYNKTNIKKLYKELFEEINKKKYRIH